MIETVGSAVKPPLLGGRFRWRAIAAGRSSSTAFRDGSTGSIWKAWTNWPTQVALLFAAAGRGTVAGVVIVLSQGGQGLFTDEQLGWPRSPTRPRWLGNWPRNVGCANSTLIARDLHDHVIQRLFAVAWLCRGAVPHDVI